MMSLLFVKERHQNEEKTRPHLLNASFAQLQHRQVVVSLRMVIIEGQGQFETLVGQRQVSDAL